MARNKIFSSPFLTIICLFNLFTSILAASAVLGVDLGTEYIKAALVKPGIPLEIVLTKDSRRKETAAIAFKPQKNPKKGEYPERAYGSDAVALSARFPGDVYPNLKTLLGLSIDNSVVSEWASRRPALKLVADKTRNTAAFLSGAFTSDEEPWTVEEILAMELQSIQKNAESLAGNGSKIKDLVITVPHFYTAEEKRAVQLAADLAGLRVLELVSDGLAVGLNYATSRTFPSITTGGKPEYHMVFDMGAGSTKASVLKFQGRTVKDVGKYNKTIQEVHVLGNGWDRTLGGDALNAVIMDNMIAQFVESPKAQKVSATIDGVKGYGRAASKLWKEAERLRQVLSANTNTQASFEGLYEDVDFKYKISRAEFETMSMSHAARVGVVIQKALDMAELEVTDLDSVILHGGASRTPFVQKELEKIFGNPDKIRTNVNSDEAAVFGAGFRGAGLSPSFRVKEIRAFEVASFRAGIKWTNIYEKPQHQQLWKTTSFLGAEKQYVFKNQKDFSIEFYQHVPSLENFSPGGAEKSTFEITTLNLTESTAVLKEKFGCTDDDINLKLSTRLGYSDGEVAINKLYLDCEVEDVEKPGVVDSMKNMFGFGKKDQVSLADGESSEIAIEGTSTESSSTSTTSTSTKSAKKSKETKDSKKDGKLTKHFEVVPVAYKSTTKGLPELPTAEITRMKERISAFADSDRSRRLREEALNQLEGFTYKARDVLADEAFIAASTEEERASLEAKAKDASEWIYAEGRDATREELKSKLNEMKEIVTPVEKRKEEAAALPAALEELNKVINDAQTFIKSITGQIKNETEAHEQFTASKVAASKATPTPSPSPVDDFVELEEEASETTTAPVEEETMDPPTYKQEDLTLIEQLDEEISIWLAEILPKQKALQATDNPILLVKDVQERAKKLTDAQVDLLMKSMKKPYKSARPTKKKTSKPKKSKKTKINSAAKGKPTINFGEEGENFFKMGENGEMPSEEDIKEFIDKQQRHQAAKDQLVKEAEEKAEAVKKSAEEETTDGDDTVEPVVEREDNRGHDEL
ncbi:Hsp70 protein-domain-containing protein [Calycina marina]|uniref:Hsp70 protein-domain-containing protein n=1 Tax=Calycina marina TaxID=1763456 RepID=A0A9P7Z591_9HELO|nr:Hsp70 protein-domain-containing protein [Calycina marina]